MPSDSAAHVVGVQRFVRLLPRRSYVVPDGHALIEWLADYMCPSCGMAGHWRSGVHFDHEMICLRHDSVTWEPGLAYLKLVSHEPNAAISGIITMPRSCAPGDWTNGRSVHGVAAYE